MTEIEVYTIAKRAIKDFERNKNLGLIKRSILENITNSENAIQKLKSLCFFDKILYGRKRVSKEIKQHQARVDYLKKRFDELNITP